MNTCGTCKYKGEVIPIKDWDDYDNPEPPSTYFLCTRIEHDSDWKRVKGHGAMVEDGSGYYAALCVEDDFGCVKWEAP